MANVAIAPDKPVKRNNTKEDAEYKRRLEQLRKREEVD